MTNMMRLHPSVNFFSVERRNVCSFESMKKLFQPQVKCVECRDLLVGRSDKRFCDDHCRVRFHRRLQDQSLPLGGALRRIDLVLQRNRKLLTECRAKTDLEGQDEALFRWLRKRGFDFNFHTHLHKTGRGELAVMCYDVGYTVEDDGVRPFIPEEESQ
jgi:hypothetical protein